MANVMDGQFMDKLFAWVRFTCATGVILQQRGTTSMTTNGVGDYQWVIDRALDVTESYVEAFAEGAVQCEWSYVATSDTSKQFLALDNTGAAVDPTTAFLRIYQIAYGTGL